MIVERPPAPLGRDLADVSSTAACDPSCSPAYSSSCSSPCSPYSDSEGSLSGSSNGSAWNLGGDPTRGGGKQTKATFQGVRVRNSVKELLMHIRNSKLVSSTYGGEEFKGGWNIEQYRELNNIWSNTKRSYGYSSEGPACKRPTTFQTPPLLTPLHMPNSIDRMDNHKNETRNKSCEMLQNIINIKNESSPVSLNTVQVSWMSSPVNSEQSLEEQYQDIQVKQTQECQVLKASSPQVMDQSQMCDFPYLSSRGLQTPFAHHSLTDSSQLSANYQFPNYEKGLFSSCQEVLYWPDQSFAYCLNETEGCPDTNLPVQLQPKASAQSLNYSPVSSNTVCCQQVLAGSCSSISPQCPSGDGNQVATMQPSKSFFQWQLDQEELRMANITQEQLLAKDSDGDTFLHIAVAQGRRARSYVLARKMAAVNKLDIKEHNNQTALQVAVAANQHLIVQDLVGLGAQVNTTDCWGRTPLHVCAEKGYSQVLQAIQMGVNGNNQYVDAEATNYDGNKLSSRHSVPLP